MMDGFKAFWLEWRLGFFMNLNSIEDLQGLQLDFMHC